MALTETELKSEITTWLKNGLKDDKLKDISINNLGSTEKGDGYLGDIVFVEAEGTTENGSSKNYNLVLKCSKRSKVLRETAAVNAIFVNEIYLCQEILPRIISFQKEKGIDDIFDSVPKYHGSFVGEDMEVIILENLRKLGYELWPKKIPQNKNHIYFIVKKYAQFHATSLAVSKQQPELFQKWVNALENNFKDLDEKKYDMDRFFGVPIEDAYELLKNDLDKDVLTKWRNLKNQIDFISKMPITLSGMKIVTHGDSWNNNFMFFYDNNNKETPAKVAFLDWQIARYSSPILDLSYFIFACASQDDLEKLNDILAHYHNAFIAHLEKLDVKEAHTVYPFQQFMEEWNSFARHGILMATLLMKICATDKDEVVDIKDSAESAGGLEDTFNVDIKDKDTHKKRIRPIVESAVKYNLI